MTLGENLIFLSVTTPFLCGVFAGWQVGGAGIVTGLLVGVVVSLLNFIGVRAAIH